MPDVHVATEAAEEMPSNGLVGDSATIATAVAISRATGLVRIAVVAAVLGPTVLGDLFVAVNVLPLILYDIIAGSAISSVLVPPIVRLQASEPIERVRRFVGNAGGLVVVAMGCVVVAAVLARGWLAAALTAGVDEALASDGRRSAIVLIALIVPQLVLYGLIGVFVAVQHSRRRFLVPSAAPIVENLVLICAVAAVGLRSGAGRDVDSVSTETLLLLGLGSSAAVAAHAIVQFIGARRAIGPIRLTVDRSDAAVRALAGPARDTFGWSSVLAGRQFVLVVAASFAGAGAVQAFEIATLVYFIPLALIGRPVASAALPRLAATTDRSRVPSGYLAALRLAGWLAVPAGLGLVVLAQPLAAGIASGRFDGDEPVRLITYGLVGLGVGAATEALFEVARQAMMASDGDRAALRQSTWIRAGFAAVGVPAVVVGLDGPMLLLGLGLVVSASDALALLWMHRALRAGPAWPSPAAGGRHWPRVLATSVVAVGVGAVVDRLLPATIGDTTRLAVIATATAAAFVAAAAAATNRGRLFTVGEAVPVGDR